MVKTIYWIQHTKRIETEKNNDRDGKALYKLMNNATHGKCNENEKQNQCAISKKRLFKMHIETKLYVA